MTYEWSLGLRIEENSQILIYAGLSKIVLLKLLNLINKIPEIINIIKHK